ncbi:MAG: putative N6-adenine-specific DNA methylase, partial [Kiritimatiellia bacterium]
MSRSFFASCTLGLEDIMCGELQAVGAEHVKTVKGGATFVGTLATAYRACLWTRSSSRIGERLFRDRAAGTREQVYDAVFAFDWDSVIKKDQTFAIHTTLSGSYQNDTRFLSLVAKDAICDKLREQRGSRPDVDTKNPDVPLRLVIQRNRATLLRDMVGSSMHRRGWRPVQHKSPLNEATAAGLLLMTGWDGSQTLLDPMCGSATFLIEAAHIACDRAPGLRRRFAFESWHDLDKTAWREMQQEAEHRWQAGKTRELQIWGSDIHAGALQIARHSSELAGVRHIVKLKHRDVAALSTAGPPDLVVCNPPWGRRLEIDEEHHAWAALGDFLREKCRGASAWTLSGDRELTQHLRLKANQRVP